MSATQSTGSTGKRDSAHRRQIKSNPRGRAARASAGGQQAHPTAAPTYRLPAVWDCWGYSGPRLRDGAEVLVDPRDYARACLDWIQAQSDAEQAFARRSLSQIQEVRAAAKGQVLDQGRRRGGGDWIRAQLMYGLMMRTSTAWDHDGDGRLRDGRYTELGTFLKTILLLPLLRRMGISVLYLLPVSTVSKLYRKGELGCPYAARNFLALDPAQHDRLVQGGAEIVDLEFAVFVECAHRLGMRVMIDVAPRTAARDNDWIIEHPDWFYWIDQRFERSYRAPRIPGVSYHNPIPGRLEEIYGQDAVQAHLARFRFAPNVAEPQRWANFASAARDRRPADLLREIARHFGVVTPPGFSDCVNDTQPPWSDVTYLRLFLDHPVAALGQLPDPAAQPPYVLFDTAKASLFPGRRPNRGLWKELSGIIPFYQGFGVDGARVDMAHALPRTLESMILSAARRRDPDFCFLAEELGSAKHAQVRAAGYNIIIGPSWWMQPRGHEGLMHKLVSELPGLRVPAMAAAETPDTPRAVVRRGGRRFSRQAVVLNMFLPNAVPMINSGQEVHERQPMNLGLDVGPPGRAALPADDPLAGKLGFFDRYALHWGNAGGRAMIELITRAAALRGEYLDDIVDPRSWFAPQVAGSTQELVRMSRRRMPVRQARPGKAALAGCPAPGGAYPLLATGFLCRRKGGMLLMLANLNYRRAHRAVLRLPERRLAHVQVLLAVGGATRPRVAAGLLHVLLTPGDVQVLRVT